MRLMPMLTVSDVIGRYVELTDRAGTKTGACPLHDDPMNSLSVSDDDRGFHCSLCGFGGDVFSWLMRLEGVEFGAALTMLREKLADIGKGQGSAD